MNVTTVVYLRVAKSETILNMLVTRVQDNLYLTGLPGGLPVLGMSPHLG